MKKYLVLLLLLVPCLICNAQNSSLYKQRLAGIDSIIQQVMRDWKIAGVSVGVVYKDEVIYSKGYGYRDIEKGLPVTPHTVFHIASCTKAFTAMTVGLAANDGLLNINKPVHQYFPELEFYTPQMTEMITAKDMMTHRTGLPRHDWATQSLNSQLSLDSIIHRMRYLEPSAVIREKVQYNNLMYLGLGALTQKLTGKLWEQQIKDRIFAPLGMNESSTGFRDLPQSTEYSKGYRELNGSMISGKISAEGANPAGSINSSALDMCKWLSAWINGGKVGGKQIFPANFVREASTPQMATPSRPNPALLAYGEVFFGDIGYGWVTDSYRGHYRVQHSGDLPLYSSNTSFFPSDSIGIVVLVNKFNSMYPEMLSSYFADKLLDLPFKDWYGLIDSRMKKQSTAATPAAAPKNPVAVVPARFPVKEYAGIYIHPGYGTIRIISRNDSLFAAHNDQPISFSHGSGEIFNANVPNGKLKFTAGPNNKIQSVSGSFEDGISDIVFVRKEQND